MPPSRTTHVDRAIRALAEAQEGLVAHRQLVALGLSVAEIRSRRERGWLIAVRPGVYAVGTVPRGRRPRWVAALLHVGPDAVLSHDTAGCAFGVFDGPWFPIHVTAVRWAASKQSRLTLHRTKELHRLDWVTKDGLRVTALPLTALPLTLIDLAGAHGDDTLLRAVERMASLHVDAMRRTLARHVHRRGTRRVHRLLDAYDDHTRSYLERAFLLLCRAHGIPKPQVNATIAGRERDPSWPTARLVVEADGRAFHGTPRRHAADDRRDVELGIAGWRPHRFSYERIVLDPGGTAADVKRLLGT